MKRINLIVSIFLTALLFSVTSAFCQERTISPEKAMMLGYVENFFNNNARDITMRKSLEWGEVQTDDKGNRTIRYKFEALIWDKDRLLFNSDLTFDKDGKYVSMIHVEGFPKPVEKPDVTTLEGVQKLVEKFFSQNFRDITARKTLSWGELEKHEDGSVSLIYRYEATIWDKDVILEERRFTFDKNGEVKSWDKTAESPKAVEKAIEIESLKQYPVNKSVADFKGNDVSTPESAYATLNKIMASKDKDVIVQWEKYDADGLKFTQRDIDHFLNIPNDWAKILQTAEVLNVYIYDDQVAIVIAKLGGENTRNPYDVRMVRKVDGKWLNTGNDRVNSPEEALLKFSRGAAKVAKERVRQ
jgi:hypothetical protein